MRHCENEVVEVFEAIEKDPAVLLRQVAEQIEAVEYGFVSVNVDFECETCEYRATLYVH